MGTPQDSEKTRAKILNAAGELFAEKGYAAVTVREIISQANTHLSAMNYHFASKEALYKAVLTDAFIETAIGEEAQTYLLSFKPEKALLILIQETLKEYKASSDIRWRNTLIAKEIQNPGEYFEALCDTYLRPDIDFICGLLAAHTGKNAEDDEVRFAVISMIGQMETFGLHAAFIDSVAPGLQKRYKEKQLAQTILDITIHTALPSD